MSAIADIGVRTAVNAPCRRVIDLGNGVMFPVDNDGISSVLEPKKYATPAP